MNLTNYLFEKSKATDKTAIFFKNETISYPDLYSRVQSICRNIWDLGYGKGDKVALISENSFFFVSAYLGIIGSGCTCVPLNPRISTTEMEYILNECDIRAVFIQNRCLKRSDKDLFRNIRDFFVDGDEATGINIFDLNETNERFAEVEEKTEVAVILFTSGSTGKPRGVMLSHFNIIFNTNSIIQYMGLTDKDRVMAVLPFFYCYGTSLLHTHMRVGGQVVINNQFMFPGKVLNEINEKECTGFAGVPSTFQILLRRTNMMDMEFPTLRYVQQAGGKLPKNFIEELIQALPTTDVYIMYGQTEATARLSYLPPDRLKEKLGSIGNGISGTDLEVLNEEGEPVKPGEVGEIVASGGNIMLGYWNAPQETDEVLKQGKLLTGDLATVDEEGLLYIVDRHKNIIKSGGNRISPQEIENIIVTIPDVVEVIVIGVPDDIMGEAVKAFISLKGNESGIDDAFVIDHCRKDLPPYKVPKYVEFVQSLPKNSSGKVMIGQLKER